MDALHGHSLNTHCGSPVAKPDFRHKCGALRRAGHAGVAAIDGQARPHRVDTKK